MILSCTPLQVARDIEYVTGETTGVATIAAAVAAIPAAAAIGVIAPVRVDQVARETLAPVREAVAMAA